MIEYRPFHNTDPPRIAALWNDGGLGRGAVQSLNSDTLETVVFAQPYFDRGGLIVACDAAQIVGFVHAGFGATEDESRLDHKQGVICVVIVQPQYRRRGIGRELVSRAERYLREAGATSIHAGAAPTRDPFYFGIYGGSDMAGFLDSDPAAAPFFEALGYYPLRRRVIYQCDLDEQTPPISMRLVEIRRRVELQVLSQPDPLTWWWSTRFGRLESLRFLLCPKSGGPFLASITVIGLEHYEPSWQAQAIGMTELYVAEPDRRKGFGQALLLAVTKRLRDELFTLAECHAPQDNTAACRLLESCGFEQIDSGTVYQRSPD